MGMQCRLSTPRNTDSVGLRRSRRNLTNFQNLKESDEQHYASVCQSSTCIRPTQKKLSWIECTTCETWFHAKCVGLTIKAVQNRNPADPWVCPDCLLSTTIPAGDVCSSNSCDVNFGDKINDVTRRWIQTNVCQDERNSMKHHILREAYEKFCDKSKVAPIAASTFGVILHGLFPLLKSRRLGGRQKQNYHYMGITFTQNVSQQTYVPDPNKNFIEFLTHLKHNIPVMKRIPKASRKCVAECFTKELENCTTANGELSWFRLFSLPYFVLQLPKRNGECKSLSSYVKGRVEQWQIHPLNVFPTFQPVASPTTDNRSTSSSLSKKIESKLSDGDVKGALRLLTSDDIIAPKNSDTLSSLIDKHPDVHKDEEYPDPPDSFLESSADFEDSLLYTAIKSFPNGSAGGMDSLRPQMLKDILNLNNEHSSKFITALKKLILIQLKGNVPSGVCTILYGASLTALKKKCGGLRPIAVGMTYRRICSKIVSKHLHMYSSTLHPHQLGFSVKGGCEAGVHAARIYFEHKHAGPKVFIKVDYKNAFNMLRRDVLLQKVKEQFPEYYPYIHQLYRNPSTLMYGDQKILSRRGVQQGDPLGPALFCFGIQTIVDSIKSELNLWFLDDGTIAGDPDVAYEDLMSIIELSKTCGLELNFGKCEIAILGTTDQELIEDLYQRFETLVPGSLRIQNKNAVLLGSPIHELATPGCIQKKTETLKSLEDKLLQLSSHTSFYLLRLSLAIPRLIYFLRCCPAWKFSEDVSTYDETMKALLEKIFNLKLSENEYIQACLPVKKGGLGLRKASKLMIPAFLSSSFFTMDLVNKLLPEELANLEDSNVTEALTMWSSFCPAKDLPSDVHKRSQKNWEEPMAEGDKLILLDAVQNDADKARLVATDDADSGAWLNAYPSKQLGTHLDNPTFRIAVGLRLGSTICRPHDCKCGAHVNESGHHGLSCKLSAGRLYRHSTINDLIKRALISAEVPACLEPAGLSRKDGKRPDGLTLVPWSCGKSLIWDFTCVDTFAISYLDKTKMSKGSAADMKEDLKVKHYEELMGDYIFIPIAIETAGSWGHKARHFINSLGQKLREVTGEAKSRSYLVQRISIALQRGNAASILGTIPSSIGLDEIFYIL